jgi:sugar/nucleoside kinase (ribokinase family)
MDLVIWSDRFESGDEIATPGKLERVPGGSMVISAVAAARLGALVRLTGRIGADRAGEELRAFLLQEGIDVAGLQEDASLPTTERIVGGERRRAQGARIAKGDRIDIDALFTTDLALIDVDDLALYRFLADLPVHTNPNAKLLGTLGYLAESPEAAMREIVPRLDVVAGSSRDAMAITETASPSAAAGELQDLITGSNLRMAALIDDELSVVGVTADQMLYVAPVQVQSIKTPGAEEAFTGALAFAIAARWSVDDALRLGSVVAGLTSSRPVVAAGLPYMDTVRRVLDSEPSELIELG